MRYSDLLADVHPGPYVDVRLSWDGQERRMKGLLDTGADQSIVPEPTAQALGLRQIDEVVVEDANGGSETRAVYVADLELEGFVFRALPMAATDYPIVLIGRDVLNDLTATFDGPAQEFSLRHP